MSKHAHTPRFVVRDPVLHAIAKTRADGVGELHKCVYRGTVGPAALVFEGLRQVPVVERGPRRNSSRQEPIHQPVVEIEPRNVDRTAPGGKDSRPGNAEAVRVQPEGRHHCDVLRVTMIVVARHVGVAAVFDEPRLLRIGVPDRWTPAIDIVGTFNLEGRSGNTPNKTVGKDFTRHLGSPVKTPVGDDPISLFDRRTKYQSTQNVSRMPGVR